MKVSFKNLGRKAKSFANVYLRRKMTSETMHLFSYPENTWIKTCKNIKL